MIEFSDTIKVKGLILSESVCTLSDSSEDQNESQIICLNIYKVERPKFARTKYLQKILNGQSRSQYGIVTMDQTGRFLVEGEESKFASLGIWVQNKELNDTQIYKKIVNFLKQKVDENCLKFCMSLNNKIYISLSKFSKNQLPELYLVSWQMIQNPNCLEFTLRGEKQTDCSLTYSSPMKTISNCQLQQQLQKMHLQESPQFSSIKKQQSWSTWEDERTQLQSKVESQQQMISCLKKQVQRLTLQLKNAKKCVTSPSQKSLLNCFQSPTLIYDSLTPPQKFKKLSESDLETSNLKSMNTNSTKQKKSIQIQLSADSQKRVYTDQDPWDMIEIID